MRAVQLGPVTGFVGVLMLLAALDVGVGLGPAGWVAGVAAGAVIGVALDRGVVRHARRGLGPADRVTLVRGVLAAAVAALTAESFSRPASAATLVALSTIGLLLDGVDGKVARRTRTVSELGARFDMEVDAFLILVLSVYVARTAGWWVLAIGLFRYGFIAAGWLWPRLRASVPARYWRKVVAVLQGVALTVYAAGVLPHELAVAGVAVALALLVVSFGLQVLELSRARPGRAADTAAVAGDAAAAVEASEPGSPSSRRIC